ncbi:hypothetical protein [Puia sp.]|jgi:hypothetical protein|uniref:hypothetical protein n=1 Tax=Puia sp. TaxID=2045100 RepID=UPI002F411610
MSLSQCGLVGGNTGGPECDPSKDRPVGLTFGGGTFDAGDYVDGPTFAVEFVSKTKLATGDSEKLFPFPELQGNTDQTEAPKTGSLGYGLKFVLLGAKPAYEFDVVAGSTTEQKLFALDGATVPVYVHGSTGKTWGTRSRTTDIFKGFKVLVSIVGKGFDDAQNVKSTKVTLSFVSSDEFYKTAAYITTDMTSSDLVGLMDGIAYEPIAHTVNAYKIGVKVLTAALGGDLNVYDSYADELVAGLVTAFTGAAFGTTLAITSFVKDTVNKCWTLTFDNTAYTALAANTKIKVFLGPTPADLDAADITGLEILPIIVSK